MSANGRGDADGARRVALRAFVGIHGQVVHAHRILLGLGRRVRQTHRIAVVKDAVIAAGLLCGRRGQGGCVRCRAIDEDRLVITPVRCLRRASGIERLAIRVLIIERRPILSLRHDRTSEPEGDDGRRGDNTKRPNDRLSGDTDRHAGRMPRKHAGGW